MTRRKEILKTNTQAMKHVNLIGLIGRAGSGKDTVYSMINRYVDKPYENKKFASSLKVIAGMLLKVHPDKFEDRNFKNARLDNYGGMTVREFLQKLGTDAVRDNLHVDTWVNSAFSDYTPDKRWVFTDCRMLNEAARIKAEGGKLVRIIRWADNTNDHITETEMDSIEPDYIIYNDTSFHDLYLSVDEMLKHFQNED